MALIRYVIKFSDQLSKFLMVMAALWALGLSATAERKLMASLS